MEAPQKSTSSDPTIRQLNLPDAVVVDSKTTIEQCLEIMNKVIQPSSYSSFRSILFYFTSSRI